MSHNRGFTLLELLVVLGIIGLLAVVATAALGTSRDKGGDGGIKQNLQNARPQAELYFTNQTSSYEGVCNDTSTGIFKQIQASKRAYGGALKASYTDTVASTWDTEECHDAVTTYVVWIPVKASTLALPRGWCIDNRGTSKLSTAVLAANATQCP